MNYDKEKYDYLKQFYTAAQIDLHCQGDNEVLNSLWISAQPTETTIKDLIDNWKYGYYLIDSPDGYIPVVDTVVKQKVKMYKIEMQSGKSLTCSYDHYLQDHLGEWIYAQNLTIGSKLLTVDGMESVTSIHDLPGSTTYDVEVGHENHRFYTNGISSHNTGKSLFLQNQALNLVKQGLNVIYISLELSEELTSMRMDSMLTEVGTRDIFRNLDTVELKVAAAGRKSGDLYIRQIPQGSTCNDLKVYLKNYEIERQKKPDVLIVDYLDLLFPNNKKINPGDLFIKDKFVTEEMRGLGVERGMIVLTASQLNRSSVTEQEHDHSMIAGGISKIQTADNVISIFASAAMKERGQYQIQFLKTRSSSGVGSKVYLGFDPNTLRIFDLEDGGESIMQQTNASEVMDSLRRRNSNVKKDEPKADAQPSTPVRDLKSLTALIRR
jgi:archaellum biogenesis ATPase FlaH